jgi:trigger factor
LDVKVIPAEKWKRYIEVTVPAAEVESEVNEALRRYQKKVQIQGFRKGKAPLHFVKQIYGGAIRQETLEELVPKILTEAREQNGLKVLGAAEMEEMKYDEKDGLNFRAAVEVSPEIELRQYKDFEFEKTLYDIAEADVEEALAGLREQQAVYRVVSDGEVMDGHIVVTDLQKVDAAGFALVGDKHENQRLLVSAEDDFTRPLIGARVGETRRTSFTERLPDGKMAEKPTHYQAGVKEIIEKILPPLDEAFAALYKFQTVEELKSDVRQHLLQRAEQRTRDEMRREIVDELLKVNAFELPEKMAEAYAEKFFESVKAQFAGMPEETIKSESRAAAFRRLRWEFLRARIVAAENLDVSDDEMRDYIVQLAFASKEDPQRLINRTMNDADKREQLRGDLLEAKTMNFLEAHMKYRERRTPYKDRGPQRIITV